MLIHTRKFINISVCILIISLLSTPFLTANPVQAMPLVKGPNDQNELEAFLDGEMAAQMAEKHIQGAVISIVKDSNLFFAKGYGYADLEEHIPVNPELTLFRPGSVSKLFVWTAVMQLYEQGKLDLDADINTYLDFNIPATYSQPITMKNLLSHTPGFEEVKTTNNLFRLNPDKLRSLEEFIKSNIPARVFPPGKIGAYSNYGTALAGYIVERISGLSFNEYVEQNIFTPLEMTHATFRQPLPETLASNMSTGYNYVNGEYLEGEFEIIDAYPAGSLSASATDMANFMIAHLQNGRYGEKRILQEATVIQMHNRLFTHDERIDGMAYGFFENVFNVQRVISHGGDTILFHSGLFLIPEQNVGLFISTNSVGGAGVGDAVIQAFIDHYYPVEETPAPIPPADFAERISPYIGEYTLTRNNFTTFEKLFAAMTPINVSLNDEGYLLLSLGETQQFVEVEPGLLQGRYDPDTKIIYRTDEDGRVYLLSTSPLGVIKKPWYGSTTLHVLLLVISALLLLDAPIRWLIGFLKSLCKSEPQPSFARLARGAAVLFSLLLLIFLIGLLIIFSDILPTYGVPRFILEEMPVVNTLLMMPIFLGISGMIMLVFTIIAWIKGYWKLTGRIHYSLLTLSALSLIWIFSYWNLLF